MQRVIFYLCVLLRERSHAACADLHRLSFNRRLLQVDVETSFGSSV